MPRKPIWLLLAAAVTAAQTPRTNVQSGRRYPRIVVRNAMLVDGAGTPASGPRDIVIENNLITEIASIDPSGKRPAGDVEIDASGKYVLPGLIDAHAHLHDERGGLPQPIEY